MTSAATPRLHDPAAYSNSTSDSVPSSARPLVSIIVPSFNQGRFVRQSIQAILDQDYRPLEILVMDGASTDETVSILHEFDDVPEVTWVSEPDSGVVEAVNKGFARARGEIGAIQSTDDFYLPGAISSGVNELIRDPALAFVYGDIVEVDAIGGESEATALNPFSLEGMLSFDTWVPQPSTFFRMAMAKSLGGWREAVPYAADTDLWLRMATLAPALKIDRLMAQRTMHPAQRDKQGAKVIHDYGKAVDGISEMTRANPALHRAAQAGKLLVANRYGYGEAPLVKILRAWRAAFRYPRLFARMGPSTLVPGWLVTGARTKRLAMLMGFGRR